MVTEAIVSALVGILEGLVSPLPTYTLDTASFNTTAVSVGSIASVLNGYAPIAQVGIGLAVVLGLKLALLTWQVVVFIYHQFWGSN